MTDKPMVTAVALLRVPDGREFEYRSQVEAQYADNQEFWWTDGNASCDCNRSLFIGQDFGVWLGTEPQEYDGEGECSLPCGDTITLLRLTVDGVVVYELDPKG